MSTSVRSTATRGPSPCKNAHATPTPLRPIVLALLAMASVSCLSERATIVQQQRSPDGRLVARLEMVEVEGGADYLSRVVIAPSGEPFDKDESGAWVFRSSLALRTKSIAWHDDHHVDVVLSGSGNLPQAHIETQEREGVSAKVIIVD